MVYPSRVPFQKTPQIKIILPSAALCSVASWCLLLRIAWTRNKAVTFEKSMIYPTEGIPQHLCLLCESCFGIPCPGPSYTFGPGHAGVACNKGSQGRGGLLLREITAQIPSLSGKHYDPAFTSCYTVWREDSVGCAYMCQGSIFSCGGLKTTRKAVTWAFQIFAPQWQHGSLASNSSIKWKIAVLWFHFADQSCLPLGTHTELLWAPREGSLATATRDGQHLMEKAMWDIKNVFRVIECTKVVQYPSASMLQVKFKRISSI